MSNPSSPNDASLAGLPAEIHLLIASHFALAEKVNLRATNTYFHNSMPEPTHYDFIIAGYYKCCYCKRILWVTKFDRDMTKDSAFDTIEGSMEPLASAGRRGYYEKDRYCLACGLHPKRGNEGYSCTQTIHLIGHGNLSYSICIMCRSIFRSNLDFALTCDKCVFAGGEHILDEESMPRVFAMLDWRIGMKCVLKEMKSKARRKRRSLLERLSQEKPERLVVLKMPRSEEHAKLWRQLTAACENGAEADQRQSPTKKRKAEAEVEVEMEGSDVSKRRRPTV